MIRRLMVLTLWMQVFLLTGFIAWADPGPSASLVAHSAWDRLPVYLAAGDYRRAIEACERALDESPSVTAYVRLTYVYHALDAYLDHLSKEERWVAVEHLYLNLAHRDVGDLVDPPGGLARMAKEMIQTGAQQQADVNAALATRLNKAEADRLWSEQTLWRQTNPQAWWHGLPPAWRP